MQSGYGGVSEIQQFMVESCGPSLFSISTANPAAGAPAAGNIHSAGPQPLKYHPLSQPHHHGHGHHPPQAPAASPLHPHFSHFHSIPITQQLFQQPTPHQFELFHHHHHHPHPPQPPPPQQFHHQQLEPRRLIQPHQLGLDQESAPENSAASPTRLNIPRGSCGGGRGPSFLSAAMGFKLAVNESSGTGPAGSREGINDEGGGILQGDNGSENRLHHWQREEDSAIKELSWRPLDLDIDYLNRNNKRCKEKEPESSINGGIAKFSKKSKEVTESDSVPAAAGSSNYKIFSELDAIYQPGGSGSGSANGATAGGGSGGGGANQTGSGSALTGDETPLLHVTTMAAAQGVPASERVGGMSETSAGEEAKKLSKGRLRRKRRQRQLSSVAAFFESLVKQLMDHQEGLHRKFLEVMERREQERSSRDEAWRKQEASKSSSEEAARTQERALASSREAAIIAFLEKISGESLNLPSKPQFPDPDHVPDPNTDDTTAIANNHYADAFNNGGGKVLFNSSRWPKAEVQALIRVRSGFESRFQEPGLKGPLWEEVSAAMAAMGYERSAKRCKEKWENINKYFRKTKESGKKRPQHSKTCPYFQQLDQLYSKFNPLAAGGNKDQCEDQNSELLDAIIVPAAAAELPQHHQSFKFSDVMGSGFNFNGKGGDGDNIPPAEKGEDHEEEDEGAGGAGEDEASAGQGRDDDEEDGNEEEEDDENEDEDEDEEEGERRHGRRRRRHLLEQEDDLRDTSLFFQRLQS